MSTAVRWYAYNAADSSARKGLSTAGFAGRSDPRAAAHAALGAERISYLRLRQYLGHPLPTISVHNEGVEPHEEAFRRRLDTQVLEDIKTWRAGLAVYDSLVANAELDCVAPPAPIVIPPDVERTIAAQVAEELRRMERGRRPSEGGSGGGGGGPPVVPATEPEAPEPPAGPKR